MTFTETILDWYVNYGRELPWRRTKDPYAIWLSEIILQQTRIAQGTAYWERFMARFPDVQSLAEASEDEVLRLWEGLGYYSRARNLHAAARQIVAQGAFPASLDGIKALKGIGDYTAAAIGSIAFGIPAAVVDGNVYRVLSRHFGIDIPVGTTVAKKEFTALAQSLLPEDRPGDFNQGMMDFGALQCTPQSPDCLTCPLRESCDALHSGRSGSLPVKKAGARTRGSTSPHRPSGGGGQESRPCGAGPSFRVHLPEMRRDDRHPTAGCRRHLARPLGAISPGTYRRESLSAGMDSLRLFDEDPHRSPSPAHAPHSPLGFLSVPFGQTPSPFRCVPMDPRVRPGPLCQAPAI